MKDQIIFDIIGLTIYLTIKKEVPSSWVNILWWFECFIPNRLHSL